MSIIPVETARSPLKRFVQWWRDLTATPLATMVGGQQAARIASEVGVSVPELEEVRHKGAAAAYPMYRRMASLGIDETQVSHDAPGVLHDLQRVCSLCADKKQCMHELKADPNNPHWQDYCPNMPTFEALEAEKQNRSQS